MNMQNILHVYTTDTREILHSVTEKRDESPQFFLRSPVVVDCYAVKSESHHIDFEALLKGLRSLSFVPVGVRHINDKSVAKAIQGNWCILRDSQSVSSPAVVSPQAPEVSIATDQACIEVVKKPIRSGQQVFAQTGDVVVLSQTSAGSEVLAAGSIHIYGKASGRILAGVNGDKSARIFCQSLNAELIAIAGCYQLLDEVDTPLKGLPTMISLEGETLLFEAMF